MMLGHDPEAYYRDADILASELAYQSEASREWAKLESGPVYLRPGTVSPTNRPAIVLPDGWTLRYTPPHEHLGGRIGSYDVRPVLGGIEIAYCRYGQVAREVFPHTHKFEVPR